MGGGGGSGFGVSSLFGGGGSLDLLQGVSGMFGGGGGGAGDEGGLGNQAFVNAMLQKKQSDVLDSLRPGQDELGRNLADSAAGKEGSLAQAQLRAADDRSLKNQIAIARSNRSRNSGLASRMQARLGAEATQMRAQNAMQAQRQAQADFGNYLGQQQNYQTNLAGAANQAAASQAQALSNRRAEDRAGFGQLLNTAATVAPMAMMAFSDEKLKKNIKPAKYAKGGKVTQDKEVLKMAFGGSVSPEMVGQGLGGLSSIFDGGNQKAMPAIPGSLITAMQPEQQQDLSKAFKFGQDLASKMGTKGMQFDGKSSPVVDAGNQEEQFQKVQAPRFLPMDNQPQSMMAAKGGKIKGEEVVKGDNEQNDTVHALLSPGEIVIPKTVVQKGSQAAKKFVEKIEKDEKKDEENSKSASSFLDALKSYTYEYKDKKNGNGKHVSVMAQDLEKAGPIGKSMVENTNEGKMVNYGKGFGAMLAAQAELNERLKNIEQKYGKKG